MQATIRRRIIRHPAIPRTRLLRMEPFPIRPIPTTIRMHHGDIRHTKLIRRLVACPMIITHLDRPWEILYRPFNTMRNPNPRTPHGMTKG